MPIFILFLLGRGCLGGGFYPDWGLGGARPIGANWRGGPGWNGLRGCLKGAKATPAPPGIEIAWLPTLVPSGTANSFFPCPVGTTVGSQAISIPGFIGVAVDYFGAPS